MKAEGVLFLTQRVSHVVGNAFSPEETGAWMFTLLDRTPRGDQRVIGYWGGNNANAFVSKHMDRLKAGCALDINFSSIKPESTGQSIHGRVESMSIAPDRWPRLPRAPIASNYQPEQADMSAFHR